MNIKIDHVTTFEDEVIVAQSWEFADMSNPQGHILGKVYMACATTKEGLRFFHRHHFDEPDQCDALVEKIKARGEIAPQYWNEDEHGIFASQVWQQRDAQRKQEHFLKTGGNVCQREL